MPSTSERCIWQRSLTEAVLLSLGIFLIGCNGAGSAASTSGSQSANDPPPSLAISSSSPLPQGQVAVQYQFQLSATGGTSPYTWQLASGSLAPGLSMESGSGSVSGTPQQSGSYSFTVEVQDSAEHTVQAQFSQAIAPATLAVSTSSLAQGMVASAYSASLAATGGTAPYGWQITAGQLPPGLGLTSDGKISGTPTSSGQYNFTAQVGDSSSPVQTASAKLSITVAALALTIGTAALPSGTINSAYNAALSGSGGTTPYTWSVASGSLPAGLSLSSSGQISGTPTATGTSTLTVQVADSSSPAQKTTANEAIQIDPVKLDAYGGRTDITCSSGATGYWSLEEINKRWWFCDPLGHAFFANGIFVVDRTEGGTTNGAQTYSATVTAKYGSVATWANEELKRINSWGFNLIGDESSVSVLPVATDSSYPLDGNGLHSIPTKLPFFAQSRAAYYSMRNPQIYTKNYTNAALLPTGSAVKDIFYGRSPKYTGYVPSGGVGDYYDPNMYAWLADDLNGPNADFFINEIKTSPYESYMLGFVTDDSDEMYGFEAGPDFSTVPSDHNNSNLSWIVATASPVQTANSNLGKVYDNTEVYTKQAWASYLQNKYGTISALNTAWGSNYTTFGTSGTAVIGESIGTGDGSTLTFTHTLAHLTPDHCSVQILVAGTAVGGDTCSSTMYGPHLSGTITFSTGALSITFASGYAPASGAAVTVNYVVNGWGNGGTGLLDEDGSGSWVGSDPVHLSNANTNTAADFNGFLKAMATEYFSNCRSKILAVFPHVLYFGPDSLGSWSAPPSKYVLQGAAPYIDAFIAGNSSQVVYTQAEIDYIAANFSDKPYLATNFSVANPDSALSAYSDASSYSTQAARGQAYLSAMENLWNATETATGSHPYIGMIWWRFGDDWAEHENWGLVTNLDNAYDGHENVTGKVACSPPLQQYTCGGEAGNYGDLIDPLKQANVYWLSH